MSPELAATLIIFGILTVAGLTFYIAYRIGEKDHK